ncbi:MAG: bacteriohemerythrin [Spirochaetaceae bacterium]|jgi:hemerythrin|nr:bacteriohemerythrin [Spirochaetaceae bacterium]
MEQWLGWKEEYSVYIESVDQQHKGLIDLINLLNRAYEEKKDKKIQNFAVQELLQYTLDHFTYEEHIFRTHGYPEVKEHRSEHEFFIRKVSQFKSDFDQGKESLTQDIISFLKGWLLHHILKVDKKYAEYFKAQGIVI